MENIVRLKPSETEEVTVPAASISYRGMDGEAREDWVVDGRPKGVTEQRLSP